MVTRALMLLVLKSTASKFKQPYLGVPKYIVRAEVT